MEIQLAIEQKFDQTEEGRIALCVVPPESAKAFYQKHLPSILERLEMNDSDALFLFQAADEIPPELERSGAKLRKFSTRSEAEEMLLTREEQSYCVVIHFSRQWSFALLSMISQRPALGHHYLLVVTSEIFATAVRVPSLFFAIDHFCFCDDQSFHLFNHFREESSGAAEEEDGCKYVPRCQYCGAEVSQEELEYFRDLSGTPALECCPQCFERHVNGTHGDPKDGVDIAPLVKKYLRPGDPDILRKALEVVILDRKASPSYFQRRLGIGYNRAAELVDLLEKRGVIGPASGSGNKREILNGVNPEVSDSAKGKAK